MKLSSKISLIALVLSSGSAFAADLPSRKEAIVPVAPPPTWTGFYAGLNAGGGIGGSNNVNTTANAYDPFAAFYPTWTNASGAVIPNLNGTFGAIQAGNTGNTSMNMGGFIGGGQVGYNYQWGTNVVAGIEADIQGSTIGGSGQYSGIGIDSYRMGAMNMPHANRQVIGSANVQGNLNWFGTVRGRLGYLVTPNLLVFGTGGLTYGGATANASYTSVTSWINTGMIKDYTQVGWGNGNASNTLVGWNAGGGLEWMFMQNWSVKAEAFYYNLGNLNMNGYAVTPASGGAYQMGRVVPDSQVIYPNTRLSYNGVIARAGVNYHFNWGSSPVVAKF